MCLNESACGVLECSWTETQLRMPLDSTKTALKDVPDLISVWLWQSLLSSWTRCCCQSRHEWKQTEMAIRCLCSWSCCWLIPSPQVMGADGTFGIGPLLHGKCWFANLGQALLFFADGLEDAWRRKICCSSTMRTVAVVTTAFPASLQTRYSTLSGRAKGVTRANNIYDWVDQQRTGFIIYFLFY